MWLILSIVLVILQLDYYDLLWLLNFKRYIDKLERPEEQNKNDKRFRKYDL